MSANRRDFIKRVAAGAAGFAPGSSSMGMSAKSFRRIIGASERINVAIAGLGRRLGAYYEPIDDANISMAMVHLANIAYRIGKGFDIDDKTGRIFDREAMKLWGREYEPGWEPKV
jgi:hypothetical protein